MRSGWPRNLGELVISMAEEPEGRRDNKVRACAETPEDAQERNDGRRRGTAKRRQRSTAGRVTSSLSAPIVPGKQGNGDRTGPCGGKEGVKSQNRCGETRRVRWNPKAC